MPLPFGEVAERLNALVSKTSSPFGGSGVRIPPSPLPRAARRHLAAPNREDRRLSREPAILRSASDRAAAGEECFGDDFSDADVYYALTDRRYDVSGIVSDTGARRERVRYTSSGESKTYAWTKADIDGHLAVGAGDLAAAS